MEEKFDTKINKYSKMAPLSMTPLLLACNANKPDMIEFLLNNIYNNNNNSNKNSKLFDINDGCHDNSTAVYLCAAHGNLSGLKLIVKYYGNNIDWNKCDDGGISPFFLGVWIA